MIPREGKRACAGGDVRSPRKAQAERVSAKATGTRGVSDDPAKNDARRCAFVGCERSELELSTWRPNNWKFAESHGLHGFIGSEGFKTANGRLPNTKGLKMAIELPATTIEKIPV